MISLCHIGTRNTRKYAEVVSCLGVRSEDLLRLISLLCYALRPRQLVRLRHFEKESPFDRKKTTTEEMSNSFIVMHCLAKKIFSARSSWLSSERQFTTPAFLEKVSIQSPEKDHCTHLSPTDGVGTFFRGILLEHYRDEPPPQELECIRVLP